MWSRQKISLLDRFKEKFKIDSVTGCWNWTASLNHGGYGMIGGSPPEYKDYRPILAHRVAYKLLIGPIPKDCEIDHLCRNRKCVNPQHLEAVSHKVNCLRGNSPPAIRSRQTHCAKGHPLVGLNLYIHPNTGYRKCRICGRDRDRIRWPDRKAKRIAERMGHPYQD